ncbi:MAG: TIGR03960 family B12-binding radical SAM protein [Sedimentisphaerales bacterium]|nr:TIGR03960 family B12-binding radical SAM protein [Sedimentisphaerales bacterium]
MRHTRIEDLTPVLERCFFDRVIKPGRYIGGEVNQVRKDLSSCDVRIALCFPDVYELGMSYNGMAILYWILNQMDGVAAERVFAPWIDAEQVLRSSRIPLFTLESKAPVAGFDIVGFSLTTELCYTNVLNMLDLAGLAIHSKDRSEHDPIVIAGGGMAQCAEPMAGFIDAFILGDGEQAVVELVHLFRQCRSAGMGKRGLLAELARRFQWAYVPSLCDPQYQGNRLVAIRPSTPCISVYRQAAVVEDLDTAPVPTRPIVPFVQAIHERINLEIMRGCPGRCRFCQASFCKRPIRLRSPQTILRLAKECYRSTGLEDICLLSLSSADYPGLADLIRCLNQYFQPLHVGISVPSLRVDRGLVGVPELVASVRKSGLTMAVEAASERLRAVINKPIRQEDLFAAAQAAYDAGWHRLKLYFMVGLPGETESEVKQIVHLAAGLSSLRSGRPGHVACTVSWFVPKPHTPFAWLGQVPRSYLEQARSWILAEKARLRPHSLTFRFHNIDRSILEAALGRADRTVGSVIETAWRSGARFDLWDECFSPQVWRDAFASKRMDLEALASKAFTTDQFLPWEHLGGPQKGYLLQHLKEAMELAGQQQAWS